MMHGERETTASGNPRAPPMTVYLEWVENAWYSLPKELIEKSFKICAVTTSTDGSENHLIHCFKHVIPNGLELLRQAHKSS